MTNEVEQTNASALLQQREQREASAFQKALGLTKQDDLQYDLARLTAFDISSIDEAQLRAKKEGYLTDATRQNVQLLIHHLFSCPSEPFENGRMAELPASTFPLPRSKPAPKARELTRWEKFAKEKGIQKRKREGKMVFNQNSKDWEPRFGYKRANDTQNEWLIEGKASDVPGEDPFLAAKQDKKDRVAKQRKREERNLLERSNPELAKQILQHAPHKLTSDEKEMKKTMQKMSFDIAQTSTGSLGKFDNRVEGEHTPKTLTKQKRDPVITDVKEEKNRSLKMLTKIMGGDNNADFNSKKAANRFIAFEQTEQSKAKRKGHDNKKGGSSKKRRN